MSLWSFSGSLPVIDASAFVAPSADLIGQVTVRAEASVWFRAVLRADLGAIVVGSRSNVQDGALIHAEHHYAVWIGDAVTIGHGAIVHGAQIEEGALVGLGAIMLNGSRLGAGSLLAAGSLLGEGQQIEAGVLAVGRPARVLRPLTDSERDRLRRSAQTYVARLTAMREGLTGSGAG